MQASIPALSSCTRQALRISTRATPRNVAMTATKYDMVVKGDPDAKKLGDCECQQGGFRRSLVACFQAGPVATSHR